MDFGRPRATTANTDAQDSSTELVVNIFSPSCTGFFAYSGAFRKQLPSLILNLAKKLAGHGVFKASEKKGAVTGVDSDGK